MSMMLLAQIAQQPLVIGPIEIGIVVLANVVIWVIIGPKLLRDMRA
jgi:hypothetical protein